MENIAENNEIIGTFMDLYKCEYGTIISKIDNNFCKPSWEDLNYHSSLDSLMPVVKKIKSLDFIGMISIQHYTLFSGMENYSVQISRDSEDNKYSNSFPMVVHESVKDVDGNKVMIKAIYKAVVGFIKWYNEQK